MIWVRKRNREKFRTEVERLGWVSNHKKVKFAEIKIKRNRGKPKVRPGGGYGKSGGPVDVNEELKGAGVAGNGEWDTLPGIKAPRTVEKASNRIIREQARRKEAQKRGTEPFTRLCFV